MAGKTVRILGVDTSLRSTGLGVVQAEGSRLTAVEFGPVRNPQRLALSECLVRIDRAVTEILERTGAQAAAIEGAFFCENARTAMVLGQARGVAIRACAARGIPVYEYAPRRVKQAIVGYGAATKEQMQKMVARLLALDEEPQEDAADALALAICHLHSRTAVAGLEPEAI